MFKGTLRECDFGKTSNFNVSEARLENVFFNIIHHSLKIIKPLSFTYLGIVHLLQKLNLIKVMINSKLSLCQRDVVKINKDAIVNLAIEAILGEGSIAKAIHEAAGPGL